MVFFDAFGFACAGLQKPTSHRHGWEKKHRRVLQVLRETAVLFFLPRQKQPREHSAQHQSNSINQHLHVGVTRLEAPTLPSGTSMKVHPFEGPGTNRLQLLKRLSIT